MRKMCLWAVLVISVTIVMACGSVYAQGPLENAEEFQEKAIENAENPPGSQSDMPGESYQDPDIEIEGAPDEGDITE